MFRPTEKRYVCPYKIYINPFTVIAKNFWALLDILGSLSDIWLNFKIDGLCWTFGKSFQTCPTYLAITAFRCTIGPEQKMVTSILTQYWLRYMHWQYEENAGPGLYCFHMCRRGNQSLMTRSKSQLSLPGCILPVIFRGWNWLFLPIFPKFWLLIKGISPYILVCFLSRFVLISGGSKIHVKKAEIRQ